MLYRTYMLLSWSHVMLHRVHIWRVYSIHGVILCCTGAIFCCHGAIICCTGSIYGIYAVYAAYGWGPRTPQDLRQYGQVRVTGCIWAQYTSKQIAKIADLQDIKTSD